MSRPTQRKAYRQQEVMKATPLELILLAYDVALTACELSDYDRATRTVSTLQDTLKSDYAGSAVGLFRLYQSCLDCLQERDYNGAAHTLLHLRDAWGTLAQRYAPALEQPISSPLNQAAACAVE